MQVTDEMVRVAAEAIYSLDPIMDQPVDLDGRPTGPAGRIPWSALSEIDVGYHEHYRNSAKAAITAALAAMWQDHVIVPRDPTDEIMQAGYEAMCNDRFDGSQAPLMYGIWTAMLAAAPSQLSKRDDAERDPPHEA